MTIKTNLTVFYGSTLFVSDGKSNRIGSLNLFGNFNWFKSNLTFSTVYVSPTATFSIDFIDLYTTPVLIVEKNFISDGQILLKSNCSFQMSGNLTTNQGSILSIKTREGNHEIKRLNNTTPTFWKIFGILSIASILAPTTRLSIPLSIGTGGTLNMSTALILTQQSGIVHNGNFVISSNLYLYSNSTSTNNLNSPIKFDTNSTFNAVRGRIFISGTQVEIYSSTVDPIGLVLVEGISGSLFVSPNTNKFVCEELVVLQGSIRLNSPVSIVEGSSISNTSIASINGELSISKSMVLNDRAILRSEANGFSSSAGNIIFLSGSLFRFSSGNLTNIQINLLHGATLNFDSITESSLVRFVDSSVLNSYGTIKIDSPSNSQSRNTRFSRSILNNYGLLEITSPSAFFANDVQNSTPNPPPTLKSVLNNFGNITCCGSQSNQFQLFTMLRNNGTIRIGFGNFVFSGEGFSAKNTTISLNKFNPDSLFSPNLIFRNASFSFESGSSLIGTDSTSNVLFENFTNARFFNSSINVVSITVHSNSFVSFNNSITTTSSLTITNAQLSIFSPTSTLSISNATINSTNEKTQSNLIVNVSNFIISKQLLVDEFWIGGE